MRYSYLDFMFLFQKLQHITNNKSLVPIILVIMGIQFIFIEGPTVSPVKIGILLFSPLIFAFKVPYITRAFWMGILYWFACYFASLFHDQLRFSTLGYLGLFIILFITFYNLIYSGALSINQFKRIISYLLFAYCVVTVLQQFFVFIGIRNLPIINLTGLDYYEWNRVPALAVEPSHSARIVSALMLGYIRCLEVENGKKISFVLLFNKENRRITFSYLWIVLMMGSGTAWIGLGLISIYFITLRSFIYAIPILIGSVMILQLIGNKQFDRALRTSKATLSGDVRIISDADGSASVRVIPLVNTFLRTDLYQKESWIGKGTLSEEQSLNLWTDLDRKIIIVEQYGLVGFIASLLLIYTCCIRRLLSVETLMFTLLLMLSLGNIYYTWFMMFIFLICRYFYLQKERGDLDLSD